MAIKERKVVQPIIEKTNQTVAEVILAQLSAWGVQHLYGVAGDSILPFLDAIHHQEKLKYIGVRHESAAGFMASAEGKCTGRIGVGICTSGPGLLNMLNGIADASADYIPTLVISGQVETKNVGTEAKQYIDQQQMIAPIAVYSASLINPEATVDVIQKALLEAITKRGVAHVSVPKDLFSKICHQEVRSPIGVIQNQKSEDLHQLNQAMVILLSAKNPMFLIGEGGRTARNEVITLAEYVGAGIIETLGAKGTIPHQHPLYIGGIGEGGTQESRDLLKDSDCVIVVGANWWPEGFVPTNTKVIQIDLAASSIESHKEVTCGLVGDAKEVLQVINQKLAQSRAGSPKQSAWEQQVKKTKTQIDVKQDQVRHSTSVPIRPQRLVAAIDESVKEDAIMVIDTGDHTIWFNKIFRAKQQQVLYSGKWRTLGFALPAANSAKLQYPEKQVVALIGDGCFSMSMMEISTAIKYNLTIVVIVFNNQSFAMEKNKMLISGFEPYGSDLQNPNFAEIAEAFGAKGVRVEHEKDLASALTTAYAANGPVVVDVLVSDEMPPLAGQ